ANLEAMDRAGFRTLFVEHARGEGGSTDMNLYSSLLEYVHQRDGEGRPKWPRLGQNGITAFVSMGFADDNIVSLVRSTLALNSAFGPIILKPFGYSPTIDRKPAALRASHWRSPRESSPQWFPYLSQGSLRHEDYENLVRWQNIVNRRVKGSTF